VLRKHPLRNGAIGALALAVLSACATTRAPQKLPARPLVAAAAVPAREFQQLLEASYGDQRMRLLVAGRITADAVDLAALTPEGVPLFDVHFDGTDATIKRQLGVPDTLSPHAILEDLQLVFWPVAALNAHWQAAAPDQQWQVQATANGRVLTHQGNAVISVTSAPDPWSGPVELQHDVYRYHLSITTLSQTALSQTALPQTPSASPSTESSAQPEVPKQPQ
jgi:hypothetical protein